MVNKVDVFLPMRAGSERVPKKNTKNFAGIEGGLCYLKIKQLIDAKLINKIIVSTNDNEVVEIANGFCEDRIIIDKRPEWLASSAASTDDLVKYVAKIMQNTHILWTHVTSPFIDGALYDQMIESYFDGSDNFDSLMSVTKLQKFIWNDEGPISYDRNIEKWPRTQTLTPLYEVNSGAFIAHSNIYQLHSDRIGLKPKLFTISEEKSFDIDWLPDFTMAEIMFSDHK